MDSMDFNTRADGFHGFHGIHGADVRSMVVISPKHFTRERTGVMAYRAGSARVSTDRSRMTAGVRFCGSHRLAHRRQQGRTFRRGGARNLFRDWRSVMETPSKRALKRQKRRFELRSRTGRSVPSL